MAAIVTHVDDLHFTEENQRHVEADETVVFGLDGAEFDIDLTAEHAAELRKFLYRYTAAGILRTSQPKPGRAAIGLSGTSLKEAKDYRKGMRAFARSRPDLGERSFKTDTGNYFYTKRLNEEYAAYVAEHGEYPVPDE